MGTTKRKGVSSMKKKLFMISTGLLLAAMLAGCSSSTTQPGTQAAFIGVEDAKAAALSAAQIDDADAEFTVAELWDHDGEPYYEMDFTAGGQDYHYAIDAVTGTVIESGTGTAAAGSGSLIGEDEARRIALEDAGVSESSTSSLTVELDEDDGTVVYDVEFLVISDQSAVKEYDYEIHASTGEIRSKDNETERIKHTTGQIQSNQSDTTLSEQEARDIALAEVPGATEKDITLKLDRDDDRMSYEGKIIYEGMEYEFEIDAYSGAIREWDAESVFDD